VGDSSGRLSYVLDTSKHGGLLLRRQPSCLGASTQQVAGSGFHCRRPHLGRYQWVCVAVNGTDTLNHGTILQANTDLTSAVQFSIGRIGLTAGLGALYGGAFDQTYLNSSPGVLQVLCMFAVEIRPINNNRPAIYQLSFTPAGVLNSVGTPLAMASTANNGACSQLQRSIIRVPHPHREMDILQHRK